MNSYTLSARFLKRFKDYALPITIVIGIIFYRYISLLAVGLPYMIMGMLFFSYLKVKSSDLVIRKMHLLLLLIQTILAVGGYYLMHLWVDESLAQGTMLCFLCPAASASAVIVGMLGGNIGFSVGYVIFCNTFVALIAPIFFSVISPGSHSFWHSVWEVLKGVIPLIIIPLIVAMGMKYRWPKAHASLSKYSQAAFWLWVFTLAVVIAKTVDYMSKEPASEIPNMIGLAVIGLFACILQYGIGKLLSKKYFNESITLGQCLGQKNSSLAIWMAQVYLIPLAGVAVAAYSIWQNVFNAIQLMLKSRKEKKIL